ncbi:MAG: FprA family A-type flavoprotein, partial [Eubacterium aggregans]
TKHSAELLAEYLKDDGVEIVKLYDVAQTDLSYILAYIWRYKGLLLGVPAYYGQLFPKMAGVLYKLAGNKLLNHALGIFTDYSWSGGAEKPFAAFAAEAGGVHVGQTVSVQGWADAEDEAALKELAQSVANFLKLETA